MSDHRDWIKGLGGFFADPSVDSVGLFTPGGTELVRCTRDEWRLATAGASVPPQATEKEGDDTRVEPARLSGRQDLPQPAEGDKSPMSQQWTLRHPTTTVIGAVTALTVAEQEGKTAVLTLRQTSAILTHLRAALSVALGSDHPIALGRCVICAAGLSSDRALLTEAAIALRHLQQCGACGEDSWGACGHGGQHAEKTLAAIETTLGTATKVDAVDPVRGDAAETSTRD